MEAERSLHTYSDAFRALRKTFRAAPSHRRHIIERHPEPDTTVFSLWTDWTDSCLAPPFSLLNSMGGRRRTGLLFVSRQNSRKLRLT